MEEIHMIKKEQMEDIAENLSNQFEDVLFSNGLRFRTINKNDINLILDIMKENVIKEYQEYCQAWNIQND